MNELRRVTIVQYTRHILGSFRNIIGHDGQQYTIWMNRDSLQFPAQGTTLLIWGEVRNGKFLTGSYREAVDLIVRNEIPAPFRCEWLADNQGSPLTERERLILDLMLAGI